MICLLSLFLLSSAIIGKMSFSLKASSDSTSPSVTFPDLWIGGLVILLTFLMVKLILAYAFLFYLSFSYAPLSHSSCFSLSCPFCYSRFYIYLLSTFFLNFVSFPIIIPVSIFPSVCIPLELCIMFVVLSFRVFVLLFSCLLYSSQLSCCSPFCQFRLLPPQSFHPFLNFHLLFILSSPIIPRLFGLFFAVITGPISLVFPFSSRISSFFVSFGLAISSTVIHANIHF